LLSSSAPTHSESQSINEQLALIDAAPTSISGFRPIHYLGNKSRILDRLEAAINEVARAGTPVCDLFAGSGVVARRLATNRPVVAVDVQEYSRVVTSALVNPAPLAPGEIDILIRRAALHENDLRMPQVEALIRHERQAMADALIGMPDALCDILEFGSVVASTASNSLPPSLAELVSKALSAMPKGPNSVLTRYYGGIYFSYEQAVQLDSLAAAVRELDEPTRTTALAALLSTASDTVSTVGNQFAQPIRPRTSDGRAKGAVIRIVARSRLTPSIPLYRHWIQMYGRLRPTVGPHSVIRSDFRDALASPPTDFAAIYADPPYTRDHYSRFYHVLETIALGDEPVVSTVSINGATQLSRGLYRGERHQSPFCVKSTVNSAFQGLFQAAKNLAVPLVLSYSPYASGTPSRLQPRLMTVPTLVELAHEYFREVRLESAGRIAHSKLNKDELNGAIEHGAEILISAIP
jgi:16S rRNA G966 N2-methylase RsmD